MALLEGIDRRCGTDGEDIWNASVRLWLTQAATIRTNTDFIVILVVSGCPERENSL